MNKKVGYILILVLLFMFNCLAPGQVLYAQCTFKLLKVPLYAQQTWHWCAFAGGEMIMKYFGRGKPQCEQVRDSESDYENEKCCENFRKCLWGIGPNFDRYGIFSLDTDQGEPLPWDELVRQIDCNKPVGFSWVWKGKDWDPLYDPSGHYMVARGYVILGDLHLVVVNDPAPCNLDKTQGGAIKIMGYADYESFAESYDHDVDDYDFRIENSAAGER